MSVALPRKPLHTFRSSSSSSRRRRSRIEPGDSPPTPPCINTSHDPLEESIASLEKSRANSNHPCSSVFDRIADLLQKCRKIKKTNPSSSSSYVSRLYAYMRDEGIMEAHRSLGNQLVCLLVHVGKLAEAEEAFRSLPYRNEFSWTSLISGHIKCGKLNRAFLLYHKMQEDSVQPSGHTFVSLVKACIKLKDVEKAWSLHEDICKLGLQKDLFVGSALVDMYVKFDMVDKAEEVFEELLVRDVVSWNALISGFSRVGQGEKSLELYRHMRCEGISPTIVTFVCILKACGNIGASEEGQKIHAEVSKEGLETDLIVANTLIDMYGSLGLLTKAHEVFQKLPIRDVVSWTSLISGCAKHGHGEEALNYFQQMCLDGVYPDAIALVYGVKACGIVQDIDKGHDLHEIIKIGSLETNPVVGNALIDMYVKCGMLNKAHELLNRLPKRDTITWNGVIGGYAKQGLSEETFNSVEKMVSEGITPDAITYSCCFKICGTLGAIEKGHEIHRETIDKGFLETDIIFGNALIDMYAKCGLLDKAQEVFDNLPTRDLVSWNALIAGYAQKGESENVFNLIFDQMANEREIPNMVTFGSMINACIHAGLLAEGQAYFLSMTRDYGVIPTLELYTCLVDLLARAGQLDNAMSIVNVLPIQPTIVVWNTLHGACWKWSDTELGEAAFRHVVDMDEKDTAAYVCMYNIYADADKSDLQT